MDEADYVFVWAILLVLVLLIVGAPAAWLVNLWWAYWLGG